MKGLIHVLTGSFLALSTFFAFAEGLSLPGYYSTVHCAEGTYNSCGDYQSQCSQYDSISYLYTPSTKSAIKDGNYCLVYVDEWFGWDHTQLSQTKEVRVSISSIDINCSPDGNDVDCGLNDSYCESQTIQDLIDSDTASCTGTFSYDCDNELESYSSTCEPIDDGSGGNGDFCSTSSFGTTTTLTCPPVDVDDPGYTDFNNAVTSESDGLTNAGCSLDSVDEVNGVYTYTCPDSGGDNTGGDGTGGGTDPGTGGDGTDPGTDPDATFDDTNIIEKIQELINSNSTNFNQVNDNVIDLKESNSQHFNTVNSNLDSLESIGNQTNNKLDTISNQLANQQNNALTASELEGIIADQEAEGTALTNGFTSQIDTAIGEAFGLESDFLTNLQVETENFDIPINWGISEIWPDIPTGKCVPLELDVSLRGNPKSLTIDQHCGPYDDYVNPILTWFLYLVTALYIVHLAGRTITDVVKI